MEWYLFTEVSPLDWDTTNELLALGAIHIGSNALGDTFIRRFIMYLADDDAIFYKLRGGEHLSIERLPVSEFSRLRESGYIKNKYHK